MTVGNRRTVYADADGGDVAVLMAVVDLELEAVGAMEAGVGRVDQIRRASGEGAVGRVQGDGEREWITFRIRAGQRDPLGGILIRRDRLVVGGRGQVGDEGQVARMERRQEQAAWEGQAVFRAEIAVL